MSQILLFTPPFFRGTITATPSGTAYHVKPGETVVADSTDESFLIGLGFSSAAPPANPASALTMSDGSSHTITNTSSIVLGSGGTLSGSAGVGTITGFGGGGGGGGSYVGGLGIDIVTNAGTGTISNTGTIEQPVVTGTVGTSLYFSAGAVTNAGTAAIISGSGVTITGGGVDITNAAGTASGGYFYANVGDITNGTVVAKSAYFIQDNSYVFGTLTAKGGDIQVGGGNAEGAVTNIGGNLIMLGGQGAENAGTATLGGGDARAAGSYTNGTGGNVAVVGGGAGTLGVGGDVKIAPGLGATNGILLVSNIGTVDPHVLNAKWQKSVAGVGYVGVYSKG
jgi:hypothetical protein